MRILKVQRFDRRTTSVNIRVDPAQISLTDLQLEKRVLTASFVDRGTGTSADRRCECDQHFHVGELPFAEVESQEGGLFVLECVDGWAGIGLAVFR